LKLYKDYVIYKLDILSWKRTRRVRECHRLYDSEHSHSCQKYILQTE